MHDHLSAVENLDHTPSHGFERTFGKHNPVTDFKSVSNHALAASVAPPLCGALKRGQREMVPRELIIFAVVPEVASESLIPGHTVEPESDASPIRIWRKPG